ncbi:DUF2510 domain-containing protein [Nocardioides yefusunii]|uniref:DUF2510 domain-containing protein n=1 Tax=Nocardioides yefusunii TaxID=2500546 RepID=A0ABW1QXG1_9ACTN|nr:DUF2510 domain-containing protein [Nocardioides yefusunii]
MGTSDEQPTQLKKGWYPDPDDDSSLIYWDGEAFGQRMPKPVKSGGPSTWKILLGVMGGILAALYVLAWVSELTKPERPEDCHEQIMDRAMGGFSYVDPACE